MAHRLILLFLMLTPAVWAAEKVLPDPTKPPAGLSAKEEKTDESSKEPVASGLTSILLKKGAKPAVIIDGEYVELGGLAGERKVIGIGEDHVILKNADEKEVLRLIPSVEKKMIVPPKPPKPVKKKMVRKVKQVTKTKEGEQ
ncbi:MAG: hypothetical protein Q8O31_05620 [Rhodocyclaceae bacterium]|nr:hypothetical protein [Rhodocyclaceae bacterium]